MTFAPSVVLMGRIDEYRYAARHADIVGDVRDFRHQRPAFAPCSSMAAGLIHDSAIDWIVSEPVSFVVGLMMLLQVPG